MKIIFTTIKGLDSNLVWDYDLDNDRAICSTINIQENGKAQIFKLPKGMILENNSLIINNVKTFPHSYKEIMSKELKEERPIPSLIVAEKIKTAQASALPVRIKQHTRQRSHSTGSSSDYTEKWSGFSQKANQKPLSTPISSVSTQQLRPKSLSSSENYISPVKVHSANACSEKRLSINRQSIQRVLSSNSISPSTYSSLFPTDKKYDSSDYPKTILLDDLINEEFHVESRGATTAYRYLYNKQKDIPNAQYVNTNQTLAYPTETTTLILKLKKDLINNIDEILKVFNKPYITFCEKRNLCHATRKEISEFFHQAILTTMTHSTFRKAPTEFQNLELRENDPLFNGNIGSFNYFNDKSLELRKKALTINWLVLIDENFDMKHSSAAALSKETIAALILFRIYLLKEVLSLKVIGKLIKQMDAILTNLIKVEQEQTLIFQNYIKVVEKDKQEKFNGNFSLKSKLLNFIKSCPMKPLPCELLPVLQDKMATLILKKIIKNFSQDTELNKGKYQNYMVKIYTNNTDDLYLSEKWLESLDKCFVELANNNEFKKKIKSTLEDPLIAKVVSIVEEHVYESIKSLIISPELAEKICTTNSPKI